MKKLILFSVSIFFLTLAVNAQNTATVLDKNSNMPIEGVSVSLINKKGGTATDEEGKFQFGKLPKVKDNDTLYFSHIAYVTVKMSFKELRENGNTAYLTALAQPIGQVTVTGKQNLQAELQFEELAPLKEGLFAFGAVMAGDKIYVVGGDNSVKEEKLNPDASDFSWYGNSNILQIYNIENNSWEISDKRFTKRAYHNVHFHNGKLYILGGKRLAKNKKLEYLNNIVEVYDIARDTIIVDNTNPHQAVNFASILYDNNILMLGGSLKDYPRVKRKLYSNKAHLLNLETGYWYALDNIPYAKETKGLLIGKTFYLIGGHRVEPLNYIDTYDITTGEYKTIGNLVIKCERPALSYVNDVIYVFENKLIQTYNIKTKELYLYPVDINLTASEMFHRDGKLYILGGCQVIDESFIPSEKLYCIDLTEFNKTKKFSKSDL